MPQVDHGFDLFLPKLSPSAHVAYFDIERFLGVMACWLEAERDANTVTPDYQVGRVK
jgi:hypothetical protein